MIFWRASKKKYRTRSFRFFEKIFGANIIQKKSKTENYTDERYRFGWTLNSKFYVREQIFWAKGESQRGFGLEFIKNNNKKKFEKTQDIK